MIVDDGYFDVGLLDARSIANLHDQVIWASPEGVFRTDGAILDDLTRRGGMLRYYLDTIGSATSSWTFAGGATRDSYVLCVMNGASFVDCFQIDLLTLAWTRLSNMDALAFWAGQFGRGDELYWGRRGAARVCRQSTVWSGIGDSAYKNDGNGTAVAGTVETQVYPLGPPGAKRVRRVFVTSKTADYASDNPTTAVSYLLTPDASGYTSAGTLTEGTKVERKTVDGRPAL